MTCPTACALRSAWYNATNPDERAYRLSIYSGHLAACPACRAELDADAALPVKAHEADYDPEENQP